MVTCVSVMTSLEMFALGFKREGETSEQELDDKSGNLLGRRMKTSPSTICHLRSHTF